MKLQVIQGDKGKATGIYIPINECKELKKHYKDLEKLEQTAPAKSDSLKNLKKLLRNLH